MRYLLLIYADESKDPDVGTPEAEALFQEYYEFTNRIGEQGIHEGGEALMPVATATTVRVRDGETLTTDGPFAETKEQLGGFYLVNCDDLDQALEVAGQIPSARYGSIEVRPVLEIEVPAEG